MSEAAVSEESTVRCMGCGKPLGSGKTYLIVVGEADEGVFDEHGVHGHLHADCFARIVRSPRSVLDEVKRIAKTPSKRN